MHHLATERVARDRMTERRRAADGYRLTAGARRSSTARRVDADRAARPRRPAA